MAKSGPQSREDELLKLWRNMENETLSFKQIVEAAKLLGFEKRTVINYLNKLVKKNVLEKIVDINRNTYYRVINLAKLNKVLVKDSVESLPFWLQYPTRKIKQESLELINPKSKFKGIKSVYSAAFESKTVQKWKQKLKPQIKSYLKAKYPEMQKKKLEELTSEILRGMFDFFELNMKLNIFSSLKLPQPKPSEWKTLQGKVEKTLYTKVWQHLFEALMLLLLSVYEQCGSFEAFLRQTENTKILLSLEANTDFNWPIQKLEKAIFGEPSPEEALNLMKKSGAMKHK